MFHRGGGVQASRISSGEKPGAPEGVGSERQHHQRQGGRGALWQIQHIKAESTRVSAVTHNIVFCWKPLDMKSFVHFFFLPGYTTAVLLSKVAIALGKHWRANPALCWSWIWATTTWRTQGWQSSLRECMHGVASRSSSKKSMFMSTRLSPMTIFLITFLLPGWSISRCGITSSSCQHFSKVLSSVSQLYSKGAFKNDWQAVELIDLDISLNSLGDQGADHISSGLECNPYSHLKKIKWATSSEMLSVIEMST